MGSPTKESIEKVTADDLKKFHDQHYRPGNTLFGAIGDFNTDDMRALIAKQFGAWTGAGEPPFAAASAETCRRSAAGENHARRSPRFGADLHPCRRPRPFRGTIPITTRWK